VSTSKGLEQKSLPGDTTVEVVNDSDSDVYENVDISEGDDICEIEESDPVVSERIRSGSSSEETVFSTQQDRGWYRIRGTESKCVISDCELGLKRKQPVQKSSFSSNPGINSNFDITEHSSPSKIFQAFFDNGIFKILCDETNRYATQQINKKKKDGPLET
jgi:hypothetical protein